MSTPGWYADPSVPNQQRYFDGTTWTDHVQAVAPQPMMMQPMPQGTVQHTTIINQAPAKNVGVALILTFFFGPLGMLYSTIVGGIVMFVLGLVLGIVTFGLWFIVAWPIQMIWAAVAASNSRPTTMGVHQQSFAPMPQQQYQPQPYQQQPPYQPPSQLPPSR